MKLKTKEFGKVCSIIKDAIDTKNTSLITETLELNANGKVLELCVTNREYYVKTTFELEEETTLTAAVNAQLFLNLMSKLTTEYIDIKVNDKVLNIKSNGNYKIPMIFNGDALIKLPVISIENITHSMNVSSSVLQSILVHNSKELQRGTPVKPVQNYYYIDKEGCLTFTSGACVNNFSLPEDVKLLLSAKVVKLFKLFKSAETVSVSIGKDRLTDEIMQTKIMFKTDNITLTSVMSDSNLIASVPVTTIRNMANQECPYSIKIAKQTLLDALDRLKLFAVDKNYGKFTFMPDKLVISDWTGANVETIEYGTVYGTLENNYKAVFNIGGLQLIVDDQDSPDLITLNFGDHRALIVAKGKVLDILPEIKVG